MITPYIEVPTISEGRFVGIAAAQVGSYQILEGVGPWGGEWAAYRPGDLIICKSRMIAEQHAASSVGPA